METVKLPDWVSRVMTSPIGHMILFHKTIQHMDSKLQVLQTLLPMLTSYILSCYCFLQAQEAIIQAHCDSSHEARKNTLVMLVGVGTLSLGTTATMQPLSPDLSVLQQTSDDDRQS